MVVEHIKTYMNQSCQNKYPQRIKIMGVSVDPFTMAETVAKTEEYICDKKFAHLIGVNADKILQIKEDPAIKEIVKHCEIVNADGASMLIAANKLNIKLPERVAGIDLMLKLCSIAAAKGYSVYLLGAKQAVVEKTAEVLKEKFAGINICGIHDGYFSEDEDKEIIKEVKSSSPQIVFVGITSPRKELLIEKFRDYGAAAVFVGVGGSFDVISGNIPRAPKWMQEIKLEWLFRLLQEPKRLLKRYFVGNIKFLLLLNRAKREAKNQ